MSQSLIRLSSDNCKSSIDESTAVFRMLFILVAGIICLHLFLVFRTNINWDEFHFMSQIYAIQDGRSAPRLNNFHTVLFGWITLVPASEITQILVARIIQLGLLCAAMVVLYKIGRALLTPLLAMVVVLLSLTYSDVLLHGTSFRFDTLCLFFTLLATWLLLCGKSRLSALLAGAALATSILVSIKTALWLPTLLIIGLVCLATSSNRAQELLRIAIFGLTAVGIAAGIFLLRAALFTPDPASSGQTTPGLVSSLGMTAHDMFLREGLLPRSEQLIRAISRNVGHWLLIVLGAAAVVFRLIFRSGNRKNSLIILALLLPLASIIFYRNAFSYFYVYVIPPAMIAAAAGLAALAARIGKGDDKLRNLTLTVAILFPLITTALFVMFHKEGIDKQRSILEAVHLIFPEPTDYFGPHGMIPSFPRHGPFMSTWGMLRYHERGEPLFSNALDTYQPKFVLANHPALVSRDSLTAQDSRQITLLPEDREAIFENYIHHWGPIRIAGKVLRAEEESTSLEVTIRIPGPYRIESESPVEIDGSALEPGMAVSLDTGTHRINLGDNEVIALRWGGNLPYPSWEPPAEWLYDGL